MVNLSESAKNRIRHGILAGLVTALIYVAICIFCSIVPFGDNTFLMYDLKRQYADYYAYYKSLLTGENNIFYSFSTALGSGMLGFDIYYISSPFLLILSLFPQSSLPVGITLVIGLKLSIASFVMDLFLQYYLSESKEINISSISTVDSVIILMGSISWGMSGFLFAHSMNMMWIDVVLLVPALIWALDLVILKNKKITYCLLVSLVLYLNYYITYQVLLFVAMWTIYRVWVLHVKPVRTIERVVYSTFVGGICDAVILLPTALELMDSPKDISQLGLHTKGQNLSVFNILSKAPAFAYDYTEARFGWPQIYCGVIFIVLIIVFFISKKIVIREKIGIGALMSIIMLSFMFDKFNLLWHAGMEPSGHPYRQAYLWIFFVIICGTKAIIQNENWSMVEMIVATVATAVIFAFSMSTENEHNSALTYKVNALILAIYLCLFGISLLVTKKVKCRTEKINLLVLTIVVVIQVIELVGNDCYTYMWQSQNNNHFSEYKKVITNTADTINWVKEYDKSFYRMENLNPRQQNDAMQYGYNGVTHYSSAGKTYMRYLLQRLGYNDDGLYAQYGHDNTTTMDMLLGIKYLVSDGEYKVHDNYEMIYENEVSAYRNPYAMSVAVACDDFELNNISCDKDFISSDNWDDYVPAVNPFALQEELVKRVTGKTYDIFKEADVVMEEYFEEEGESKYPRRNYYVTATEDGELYMYLDGLIGSVQGLALYKNDEIFSAYGNAACIKILNLGYLNKGDSIKIFIDGGSEDANFGDAYFMTEDVRGVLAAYMDISSKNVDVNKISSSHVTFTTGPCNGTFVTIPCEKGWNAKVDGKKVDPKCVFGALTYIPIDNGLDSHFVEMIFVPQGLYVGIVISLVGLLMLMMIAYFERKNI